MDIQNNAIKAYLQNVLFVTGTACGGKSTVSRALAQRHDLLLFNIDQQFDRHRQLSDPANQPAMNKTFRDADAFFWAKRSGIPAMAACQHPGTAGFCAAGLDPAFARPACGVRLPPYAGTGQFLHGSSPCGFPAEGTVQRD